MASRTKFKNGSDRLASGDLRPEVAAQSVSSADAHNDVDFAEEGNDISKIVGMLEDGLRPLDSDEKSSLEVVVPIYNAYDDFLKCLYSLFKYQDIYRIILLDDCSTDTRVKELLQSLKEHEQERFRIEANPQNLGYLKTVNNGMKMAKNDVILLNTDTVVTSGWARKMRTCAYSNDKIATVTPFTNNGRSCSVPEFLENNEIPEGFTVDSFAECVEKASSNCYPELVTAVGFCMYIRRSVIDEIGYFDDVNFELGYGEEVDFSFRAACRGYKNVLCDNTFVFHKGAASFLDTQSALLEKNNKLVAEKYPEFWAALMLFEQSNPLKGLHDKLKREMKTRSTARNGSSLCTFDPLEHPVCLSLPRRSVPFISWRHHVPFAMLLVDLLRPRTLVELGVHYGDSYCSFCQAVAELRLTTACYGVDTWKGDPHTGFSGPEVLADLAAHHDSLYGGFSHLMQSTFDEALKHFADGTIDILHIDGYHTYEAVKHDFEAWLPKMSQRGVVLLHHINEKQRDFGAWKVWDEIKIGYPHFEFMHCHGLGILAAGREPPEELGWLFGATDERAAAIRAFFFSLGERLTATMSFEINRESAALPLSGAAGDWLGFRIELEDLRAVRDEFDAIRGSIVWQVARKVHSLTNAALPKLHSLANAALPLGSRRRGVAKRMLGRVRAQSVRTEQDTVQEPLISRTELARKHLRGVGLVLGSLDPNLRISPNVSVDYAEIPNYEGPSELETLESGSQAARDGMKSRRKTLEQIDAEAYDFVVCDQLPGDLTHPVEALQTWLRVIRPGGIAYLAVAQESMLSKSLLDLQSDGLGIRIVDSATRLEDGSKDQIFIVEKANYISKIADMLWKSPQGTRLNGEYPIDVVVPIYNACEDFERCLYSLFKHQDMYRIILIDDCSTDKRIKELLDTLQEHQSERFEVIENEENLGYVKTVNKGIRMAKNDVILLNSDTIVTGGWARKMRTCAYSRDHIATVTPFTNNGTECSIPEMGRNNEIPEGFTIDSFAELVENCSVCWYPALVTAVGFCMYIRRVIIEEIGYFDEVNFGRGYGEENDFSLRATRKGYKNVLCDNAFVFHKGAASFSNSRNALIQKSAMVLEKLYPDFWPAMHLFWRSNPLKELHDRLNEEMKAPTMRGRIG